MREVQSSSSNSCFFEHIIFIHGYYIIILFLCTGKLTITVRTDELLGVHTICCRHSIKTIYLVNTIAANQRSQMLHLLSPHSDIVNVMESPKICCRKPSTTITDL